MHLPETDPLMRYYRKQIIDTLTQESVFIRLFPIPDTRTRWQKLKDRMYWRTIRRFKEWLHRDCGDY